MDFYQLGSVCLVLHTEAVDFVQKDLVSTATSLVVAVNLSANFVFLVVMVNEAVKEIFLDAVSEGDSDCSITPRSN